MNPNKEKTDWIKDWNKLTVKSYNLKTEKYEDEPIVFVNDKSWKNVKDFISNLLQQQREEIIKEIQSDILDFLQEANDEDGIPPMVSEYFNSFYQFLENK